MSPLQDDVAAHTVDGVMVLPTLRFGGGGRGWLPLGVCSRRGGRRIGGGGDARELVVSGRGWAGRNRHRSRSCGFAFGRRVVRVSATVVGVVFIACPQDGLPSIAEGKDIRAYSLVSVEQR